MIDSDAKLAEFLPRLEAAKWVSVDTEADSLHAYPEKLCLLQISFEGEDVLIDPLARMDLSPLWPELLKHELIFNAADYDLRLLRKGPKFVPTKIFDTMLAARLLGERQFGLHNLVSKFLGVQLEKGSQTADWARRPLTPKMEAYARNDTHYLKSLADILRAHLIEKGRLSWHEESCARLVAECSELPPADQEPWRIRGCNRLSSLGLAVLRELWLWREREAISVNKPPYFILAHEILLDIANAAGSDRALSELFPRHLSPRRQGALIDAIDRALSLSEDQHPKVHRFHPPRPSMAEKRRFEELRRKRDRVALRLHIDPTLIASRAMIGLLAQDWDHHSRELMNWQRELLCEPLPAAE
ncbi:MAG: ribonuclease D [Limisphaerales bacterium]